MNFVIVHVSAFSRTPYAKIMVKSLRKHMPKADITQITDAKGEAIPGINELHQYPFEYGKKAFPKNWLKAMGDIAYGQFAYVDCDVLFTGDVEDALRGDFDIALCARDYDDGTGPKLRKACPYNIGFMVSKSPEFWKACCSEASQISNSTFTLAQQVVCTVANSGEFKLKVLPGSIYNRTPKDLSEYDPKVKIWHFKGDRKTWMAKWQAVHTT